LVARVRAPAGTLCGSGGTECWRQRRSALAYKDRELLRRHENADAQGGRRRHCEDRRQRRPARRSCALPAALPVVVQLITSDGLCWQATYPTSGVRRNDGSQLKGKDG